MTIQKPFIKIFDYFNRPQKTAQCAKERLQIIISHERIRRKKPDYLASLQNDILEVVAKYVDIKKENVKLDLLHQEQYSVLELNVILPVIEKDYLELEESTVNA